MTKQRETRRKHPLRTLDLERKLGMHYVPDGTVPPGIPTGYVLVHNHVAHKRNTPSGTREFRGWFQDEVKGSKQIPPDKLERCDCGWAGLPHFRVIRMPENAASA